jgi:signal transduction histidine kinase
VDRTGLRRLKWLTFAVAVAGVAALDAMLYLGNPGARPVDALARALALAVAILVFNEYAFGLVARRDAQLESERDRLYALHEISRDLALLTGGEQGVARSLQVLCRVTGADVAAWVEPTEDGGAVCRAIAGAGGPGCAQAGSRLPADRAEALWRAVRARRAAMPERAHAGAVPALVGEGLATVVAAGAGGPEPLGAVVVGWRSSRPSVGSDMEFAENVASLLGVAVENQRLYRQTQRMGALEERERIAREVHDGLAQALTYLKLKAESALAQARGGDAAVLESALRAIRQAAEEALGDVRQTLLDLKAPDGPAGVADFAAALAHQVDAWSQFHDIPTELALPAEAVALPPDVAAQVLRIVQEALANVRKHAAAQHVSVRLTREAGSLLVAVADDGRGFDVRQATANGHFGLGNLRERAAAIGGVLYIDSRPGAGTEVVLQLPDPSHAAEAAADLAGAVAPVGAGS